MGDKIIINLRNIWSFCQAEKRLTLRLTRYWIFIFLSYLVAIGLLIIKSVWHTMGSSVSASVGLLAPRYNISESGLYYVIIFLIGIIFLAFDVRARDTRERVHEILDARNYRNLELVLGRFLGMFLSAWIPVVVLVLIIQLLGWLLPLFGSPFGRTIEPHSLFSFPIFIALPAMAFSCALVITITLLVRQRFIAMLLSGAALFSLYALSVGQFPYSITSSIDLLGFFQTNIASDLVPSVALDFSGWIQRGGVLILTFGLLLFAAVVHPRLEGGNRAKQTIVASSISLVGIFLLVLVFQVRNHDLTKIEKWQLAHQQKSQQQIPDVVTLNANVKVNPGQALEVELDLHIQAPSSNQSNQSNQLTQLIFSLNPGFKIDRVENNQGQIIEPIFENGLLEIPLNKPLENSQQTYLKIHYSGRPDIDFAYLDSVINPRALSNQNANVALLGFDNAIFDKQYVALMPGIHWLPTAGVDVGRDDTRKRPRDFFQLNLNVDLPATWLAAGPGLRQEESRNKDRVAYNFAPKTSISEIAILAAPFESYSTTINEITFEMLVHPKHSQSIEVLSLSKEQIKTWISDKLSLAKDAGLTYPFNAFTLVEVPNTLRGYTGGWRTQTALAPPSMVLMKESGLPTARFDFDATETFGKGRALKEQQDGPAKIMRNRLIEFYNNDFTGGNVFTGIARSFFSHQISASGKDALALDYTLQQLVTLVISEQQGFFSPSRMFDVLQSMGRTIGPDPKRGERVAERVMNSFTSDVDVWDKAMDAPLDHIDPWEDPRLTTDLLALKGGGLAKIIYDILGPDKAGQIVAQILSQHRGSSYQLKDFVTASKNLNASLGDLIENWFATTGLAGFTSEQIQLYQLPANQNGNTRYQLKMHIKNEEAVTGFVRVAWNLEAGQAKSLSAPIQVNPHSAIEFGVILNQPPKDVYIEPYLSLNRQGFLVKSFNTSEITTQDKLAFNGIREIKLQQDNQNRIIIDDLDPKFTISRTDENSGLRLEGSAWNKRNDQGLPVFKGWKPAQWSRRSEQAAWGKYRHTLAMIRPGDGNSKANLVAEIPQAGRWQLEMYLPNVVPVRQKRLGIIEVEIIYGNETKPLQFNAQDGVMGWNSIGEFDLPLGDVKVAISNKTDGEVVIADAIAWSQVN